MIVRRWWSVVKRGRLMQALVIAQEMAALVPERPTRVYTALHAPNQTLVVEEEYGSLADMEAVAAVYTTQPDFRDLYERLAPLLADEGRSEIWTLRHSQ